MGFDFFWACFESQVKLSDLVLDCRHHYFVCTYALNWLHRPFFKGRVYIVHFLQQMVFCLHT